MKGELELFSLEGKNAIVTGGAMGIGFGIVERLLEAGAGVLIADLDGDAAQAAAERLTSKGKVAAFQVDVTDLPRVEEMVEECARLFGSVDILVNNAGIYPQAPMLETEPEMFDKVYEVNLRGLAFASKFAAKKMVAAGAGGTIVNIGSIDSIHPSMVGLAAYDSSKGGVLMFTKNFALEMAPHQIRVNMIAPGGITTEGTQKPLAGSGMTEEQMQEMIRQFEAMIPMQRMGLPDDIAGPTLFLASDAARYVTGAVLVVDGGRLLA